MLLGQCGLRAYISSYPMLGSKIQGTKYGHLISILESSAQSYEDQYQARMKASYFNNISDLTNDMSVCLSTSTCSSWPILGILLT